MATKNEKPEERTTPTNESLRTVEPLEYIDQVGPDAARAAIMEAIDRFAAESREESWNRRRERTIRVTRILEQNLDYDIERFCRVQSA